METDREREKNRATEQPVAVEPVMEVAEAMVVTMPEIYKAPVDPRMVRIPEQT